MLGPILSPCPSHLTGSSITVAAVAAVAAVAVAPALSAVALATALVGALPGDVTHALGRSASSRSSVAW